MFPGYLFAKFDKKEHLRAVRYAQGVLSVVYFGDVVPAVPGAFVERLKGELGEQEEMLIAHEVKAGESYEIAGGTLAGQSGEVLEVLPAGERVRLLIDFIGESREVEIDLLSLLLPGRPGSAESSSD
jgi:transcription antitermination factor NusG